jgi:V/A-type H+-transporting ATPase subunit E
MEEKLQSLLERIREEGVEKAREEADRLVREAERKAEHIRGEAEQQARHIREQAEADAESHKRNVEAELKLSAAQAISALEQKITNLVAAKTLGKPTEEAFADTGFLKRLIEQLIAKWEPTGEDVALQLAPDQQEELYRYVDEQVRKELQNGLEINPAPGMRNGFRIGPADGRYVVSFTSEDFKAFFTEHLRPHIKNLLFDE